MLLIRRRRRNQEERPDRRRKRLRDIEEDDWKKDSRESEIDFEDDLLDDDLSEFWVDDEEGNDLEN